MLLLGVLAAQAEAAAPAAAGSYDLLATEILTGSQASVTFSSLNSTYGSTYQHLQIRATFRSNRSASTGGAGIRFNSDSGTNYTRHWLEGDGSTVESSAVTSTDLTDLGAYTATTATANAFAASVVDILDPFETTKYTTIRRLNGYAANVYNIALGSGLWMNTAALTDIEIFDRFSTFVTGSRFSLYGLKKAA